MNYDLFVPIVSSMITSGTLCAALAWLTKTWISERIRNSIKAEYDQKLELFKYQLKRDSDIEIEKLRSELSITAARHSILFSRLQDKRGNVISTTYSLLRDLYNKISSYVAIYEPAGCPTREDRRSEAAESHKEFQKYYTKSIIFFPKNVANKLEKIDQELIKTFNDFCISVEIIKGENTTRTWLDIWERIKTDIKKSLDELEDEFRKLLGDD